MGIEYDWGPSVGNHRAPPLKRENNNNVEQKDIALRMESGTKKQVDAHQNSEWKYSKPTHSLLLHWCSSCELRVENESKVRLLTHKNAK